jgi:hypothetical protein
MFFSGNLLPLATLSSIELHMSFFFSPSSGPVDAEVYVESRFVLVVMVVWQHRQVVVDLTNSELPGGICSCAACQARQVLVSTRVMIRVLSPREYRKI